MTISRGRTSSRTSRPATSRSSAPWVSSHLVCIPGTGSCRSVQSPASGCWCSQVTALISTSTSLGARPYTARSVAGVRVAPADRRADARSRARPRSTVGGSAASRSAAAPSRSAVSTAGKSLVTPRMVTGVRSTCTPAGSRPQKSRHCMCHPCQVVYPSCSTALPVRTPGRSRTEKTTRSPSPNSAHTASAHRCPSLPRTAETASCGVTRALMRPPSRPAVSPGIGRGRS